MRIALTVSALLLGTGVTAQGYDGVYRPDAEWAEGWDCTSVGMDGGALAIRDGVFYGVESQCALTNPVQVRDMDATLYDLECSGEGETWTQRFMIMDTPEGIVTIRDGGDVSRLLQCD